MRKDSRILVAGGAGMVGSAIVRGLIQKGYSGVISTRNKRKPGDHAISYYPVDLTNQRETEHFFKRVKPEFVFLAAAKVGGIAANNTYRAEFIYENLQIQNNVIHQSYLSGVKKLMFLGSSCIYPKECLQPMHEASLLTGPLEYTNEPYAIAKIAGIKMCESYNIQYGTNYISVMPTNSYGPNDNFDLETSHVIPALIRKMHLAKLLSEGRIDGAVRDVGAKSTEDARVIFNKYGITERNVEIWGSGRPMREFLYSEDMADACIYIMERVDFGDLRKGKTEVRNTHINIGSDKEVSIRELSELIRDIIGFQGEILFNAGKHDGTMKKLLDTGRLRGLGWEPATSLQEGIEKTYRSYLEHTVGQPE